MFNKLKSELNKIDKKIMHIIKKGTNYAFATCGLATVFLFIYTFLCDYIHIFLIGFSLLTIGIVAIVELFVIGIIFNKIYMKT